MNYWQSQPLSLTLAMCLFTNEYAWKIFILLGLFRFGPHLSSQAQMGWVQTCNPVTLNINIFAIQTIIFLQHFSMPVQAQQNRLETCKPVRLHSCCNSSSNSSKGNSTDGSWCYTSKSKHSLNPANSWVSTNCSCKARLIVSGLLSQFCLRSAWQKTVCPQV